jgi:hypothetical protein
MYDNIKRRVKLLTAGVEVRVEENAAQKIKPEHVVHNFLKSNSELGRPNLKLQY